MPSEIYLVKAGMTMTEGTVAEWYIADGGKVITGELLYSMETEKITMDVDAEAAGTVKHIVDTGIVCDPGQVVGYIYAAGEDIPDALPAPTELSPDLEVPETPTKIQAPPEPESEARILASPIAKRLARELNLDLAAITGTGPRGRITETDVKNASDTQASTDGSLAQASPAVRRRARELKVDLEQVKGSGPRGRLTVADVEAVSAQPDQQQAVASTSKPLTSMRRTIAKRMFDSLHSTAQLTMDMVVAMDAAVKLREQLIVEWESSGIRPTYTDLVIRAVAKALQSNPLMNSELKETEIALLEEIHVGMAVALEDGLVVPVIRNADSLDLKNLSRETSRLAGAVRDSSLGMDDMTGGTFTVSAMGMFGVDSFTPILNQPQAGILGINRLYDGVGWEGDTPVRRKMMRLSLTWDHRVLDGAPAARFLKSVCDLLEAPDQLVA
jgi:pyruvate dehydrogenase E2 component (dihydrolipoamide acetyltransferase)